VKEAPKRRGNPPSPGSSIEKDHESEFGGRGHSRGVLFSGSSLDNRGEGLGYDQGRGGGGSDFSKDLLPLGKKSVKTGFQRSTPLTFFKLLKNPSLHSGIKDSPLKKSFS